MKKLLIGCGCLTLLSFCFVIGGGVYVYLKVKKIASDMEAIQADYQATNQAYPFAPPDPPVLDARRFEQYLAVRSRVAEVLEGGAEILRKLDEASKGETSDLSFGDFRELLGTPKRIANAHIQALETEAMSVNEYIWHSRIVLGTVTKAAREGEELAETLAGVYGDTAAKLEIPTLPTEERLDLAQIEKALGSRDVPLLPENLELVNRHHETLARYPFLFMLDTILDNLGFGLPPPETRPE